MDYKWLVVYWWELLLGNLRGLDDSIEFTSGYISCPLKKDVNEEFAD